MPKILISILVIVCIAAAILFFASKKSSNSLSDAEKLENAGTISAALTKYVVALTEITEFKPIPSKTEAIAASPEDWKKELDNYLSWLLSSKGTSSIDLQTITQAIDRCNKKVEHVNDIYDMSSGKVTLDEYRRLWKNMFFPVGVQMPELQQMLIQKAVDNTVSIISLVGNSTYRYEGAFINCTTAKRSNFIVYPNGVSSVLLVPGNYYVTLCATVTFSSGKIWTSPLEVLQIIVPEIASIVTTKLKTEIKGRR